MNTISVARDRNPAANNSHADVDSLSRSVSQQGLLGVAEVTKKDPQSGEETSAEPADMAHPISSWEKAMKKGVTYAENSNLEFALREFERADREIKDDARFPNAIQYRLRTKRELAKTYRRLGKYDKAVDILNEALQPRLRSSELDPIEYVRLLGELGVALRGLDDVEEATKRFQEQYDEAKALNCQEEICRAAGNLGASNYELALKAEDKSRGEEKMQAAVELLKERIDTAKKLDDPALSHLSKLWESIGCSRLSACYLEQGEMELAERAAWDGLSIAKGMPKHDPIAFALARFFYGRVLRKSGSREKALEQFNPPVSDKSTPAIALCKEPSSLHAEFLDELIQAGADLTRYDEDGYTALDWAVFNNHKTMKDLVLRGICEAQEAEAKRRKGYREILQQKLRPKLFDNTDLQDVRMTYQKVLDNDERWAEMFDRLRFVTYLDFEAAEKIPRSGKDKTRVFKLDSGCEDCGIDSLIFFSYRWIGDRAPDNQDNTQYHRMCRAAKAYLERHNIPKERLGIWVVSETPNTRPASLYQPSYLFCLNLTSFSRTMHALTRTTQLPVSLPCPLS